MSYKMAAHEKALLAEEFSDDEETVAVEITQILGDMVFLWTYDKDGKRTYDCIPYLPDCLDDDD